MVPWATRCRLYTQRRGRRLLVAYAPIDRQPIGVAMQMDAQLGRCRASAARWPAGARTRSWRTRTEMEETTDARQSARDTARQLYIHGRRAALSQSGEVV
jgi:hypothetical protein